MLVDSHREPLLGFVLPDHVLVQEGFNFPGLRQRRTRSYRLGLLIVADDLVADVDAFIANVDGGTGNELLHLVLRFAAERTTQCVVTSSYHSLGNSIVF